MALTAVPIPAATPPATAPRTRRWLRIGGIVALLLLGLIAATSITLTRLFPPARLAQLLAVEIKAATGRDFHIEGDLSIHLLPRIAVVANDLVLANAAWGSRPEMARLKRAAFEVALRPLLAGQISILRVQVDGADALLESDGHGQVNWLFTPEAKPVAAAAAAPASGPAPAAGDGLQIGLGRVDSSNVKLTYRDGTTGTARTVLIESLTLEAQGEQDQLKATINLGGQRWQAEARVGCLLGPLDIDTRFDRDASGQRIGPLRLALAGRVISGQATLHTDTPVLRVTATLASLAIDALPSLPIDLQLNIDQLRLPGAPVLTALKTPIRTAPGQWVVAPLAFGTLGGQVTGQLSVARHAAAPPQTSVRLDAKGLSVEALDALAPLGGHLKGGRVDLHAQLALRGQTPRALAASAHGQVLLQLQGTALAGGTAMLDHNPLVTLLKALLPSGTAKNKAMGIDCMVVRLPFLHGVARIDRSIALETSQLAVSASGEINLAAQTLGLGFRPQVKKGLCLSPASLAGLVTIKGPLQAPAIGIDTLGTAREAANLGAAVATGGLSLLAGRLLNSGDDTQACQRAVTGVAVKAAAPAPAPWDVGQKTNLLKKAFGGR